MAIPPPPWEIKRNLLTKALEEADPVTGCPPDKRSMRDHLRYGVINLDKPTGPTSHEVVAWVKRIMNIGRAGHGGTLET